MKKVSVITFIISLVILMQADYAYAVRTVPERVTSVAVSVNEDDNEPEEVDAIKRVSFREKFKRSPEVQISNFFKAYNRYSTKNNIAKLKEMYSDSFVNNDGFDKDTVFKLMQMSSTTYKEVKYTTAIESIKVDGNYAVVKVHETAVGETDKPMPKVGDTGIITSDIYYTDYLRKEGNKWKILSNVINYEKVDLKYGEAKYIDIDITSPDYVPEGTDYEVTMKTQTPSEIFTIGSIVNEEITFPQVSAKDSFKSLKNDELSRIVTSNKNNHNEYATVSMALTRAKVEPDTLVLNMTGMAFVMKRVNVMHINKINLKEAEQNEEQSKVPTKE